MNYAQNPITDLADCIAHAQYTGFSDIEYETRDWEIYRKTKEDVRVPARRRPTTRDFGVYAMWPQSYHHSNVTRNARFEDWLWSQGFTVVQKNKKRYLKFSGDEKQLTIFLLKWS